MPTLARLSFFLPPAQLDDFVPLYDRHLLPLLQSHGLESGFLERPTPMPWFFGKELTLRLR